MDLKSILMIVDIIIILIIGISMLIGFKKGLKKSIISLIASLTGIALLLIFLDPICQMLVNVKLPLEWVGFTSKSIKELTLEGFQKMHPQPLAENGALADFASAIMIASLRVSVLYIGISLNFIPAAIIRFILNLIFKVKKTSPKPTFTSRLGGMLLSGFKMIIIMSLYLLPLYGIVSVASEVREKVLEPGQELTEFEESIFNIVDAIETSMIKNSLNIGDEFAKFKFEKEFLGYLTRIKTNHGTINWVQEIELYQLGLKYWATTQANDKVDMVDFIIDNNQLIIDFLANSDILEVIMPPVIELITDEDYQKLGVTRQELEAINWKEEKVVLSSIFESLSMLIELNNDQLDNYYNWLETDQALEYLYQLGQGLGQSQLFKVFIGVLESQLKDNLLADSQYQSVIELIDFTQLVGDNFGSDLESIGYIIRALNQMKVFDQDTKAVFDGDNVSLIIIKLFSIEIIKNNGTQIVEELFELTQINQTLAELGITIEFNDLDWTNESTVLASVAKKVLDLNIQLAELDQNTLIELASDQNQEALIELLNSILDSQLLNKVIISLLDQALEQAGLEEFKSQWFIDLTNGVIEPDQLKPEIVILVEILNYLNVYGQPDLDLSNNDDQQIDQLFDLLTIVVQSKIFNLDYLINPLNQLLEQLEFVDQDGNYLVVTTTSMTSAQWKIEIDILRSLTKAFVKIETVGSGKLKEKETEIIEIMNNVQRSLLLSPLTNAFLQNMVDDFGYDQDISHLDLTGLDWSIEISSLINLFLSFDEISNDLTHTTNLGYQLTEASRSVIASYLLGTKLNEMLVATYGDISMIIPTKYDFSNQVTLSKYAQTINDLIEFGEAFKDLVLAINHNYLSTDIVNQFTLKYQALKVEDGISRPDLTDDLMPIIWNYAYPSATEITAEMLATVDYQQDAQIINQALNQYLQATDNYQRAEAIQVMLGSVIGSYLATIFS